jgi:nucleotide-binding universal stress UspA family protein
MSLPRNILVPTDFSQHAERALDFAVELAAKLDARVHLLNVVGLPVMGAEVGFVVTASMIDSILRDNQEALDKLVAARTGKAAFGPTLLKTGDARNVIDATAKEVGADLIIMGTHGRRGVSRMLLGSVAESVVRTSPCPVLLVRAQETP